ncbi:MAG: hypothetical protein ACOYLQ_12070 [Hyphomicrobiaceae bacterium]
MKTLYTLLGVLTLATALSVASEPASAQAKMCSNGLPDWANVAFNRRSPGHAHCDRTVSNRAARSHTVAAAQSRAHAKAQARSEFPTKAKSQVGLEPAPQVAALPKPTTGKKNRVVAVANDQVGDDTDVPNSVRLSEPARQGAGSTGKSGTCRRYLASTGQTVEVPCSQ